tara:strand:+ start:96 stop:473 length:378 start_codon:yes stop_codon:yes gene_type:complete
MSVFIKDADEIGHEETNLETYENVEFDYFTNPTVEDFVEIPNHSEDDMDSGSTFSLSPKMPDSEIIVLEERRLEETKTTYTYAQAIKDIATGGHSSSGESSSEINSSETILIEVFLHSLLVLFFL